MKILVPNQLGIEEASGSLRRGEVVVMPTETVYGLAGAISSPDAVDRIFAIKGRPSTSPLIVHIASENELTSLVNGISHSASQLMSSFWPGPLTIVFDKSEQVSDVVTAGGPTVAIRMPAHPVARKLIEAAGMPVAAPSANRFMELSPTRVQDISPQIADQVKFALDGGPCQVGLESTVIDCTSETPILLRPGQISRRMLEEVVGKIGYGDGESPRSPGQHPRHYAPQTRLGIKSRLEGSDAGLVFNESENGFQIKMDRDPNAYGAALYAALHQLDQLGLDEIWVEAPPNDSEWDAVWDRLARASTSQPSR